MTTLQTHIGWFNAAFAAAWLSLSPAFADDTELFTGSESRSADVRPNILFILDTSGSMGSSIGTQPPYNPDTIYEGDCGRDRVYWGEQTVRKPSPPRDGRGGSRGGIGYKRPAKCKSDSQPPEWFNRSALVCADTFKLFNKNGTWTGRVGQFDGRQWGKLETNEKTLEVECQADAGKHGVNGSSNEKYAQNRKNDPWDRRASNQINWNNDNRTPKYQLYDGNWMNWFYFNRTALDSRLEIVQDVTNSLLDSIEGVNVGLMRFSYNTGGPPAQDASAEGGMVIWAMENVETAREGMKAKVDSLRPGGNTPLSETLYEAGQYYAGRSVEYGVNSRRNPSNKEPSVSSSRLPDDKRIYKKPLEGFSCQKNFIVLLTDGKPEADRSADNKIRALPNFSSLVGPNCDGSGDGRCLDDMAEYLFKTDLSATVDNRQNVVTYTIGFNVDLAILESTAARGGGQYLLADDAGTLATALTDIVDEILQEDTSFAAPAVSVNAFNRTQNMNDLFVNVFRPEPNLHWPGNLKKYRLENGVIVDALGDPAIDPDTAFFETEAQSFWSDEADGANVALGGAALEIPAATARNLYTFTGSRSELSSPLTAETNALVEGNDELTIELLDIGGAEDPAREDLIDWARGMDINDENGDGEVTDNRNAMGDPLHARPVTVIYGGTPADPDAVVYVATNDGYLHAIDTDNGRELWSFVPQELLGDLKFLFGDPPSEDKHYGIDGSLHALVFDENSNGIIEGDDRVYLFFGMRRGGDIYYALDVTNKNAPELMWVKDSSNLPGLGQTWSAPVATRVNIDDASYARNDEQFALIFGGGYNTSQDNPGYSTDDIGNGIYIVDAISGELLWRAGGPGSGANLVVPEMENSIPGDVRVLDLNQDGFADRLYAADMGGRVFRFDIFNGEPRTSLVTGGLFAELGAAGSGDNPPLAENRRFYYAPDVSLVNSTIEGVPPYLNITLGSGYRAHPLNQQIADRFYSLRDPHVFTQLPQTEFNALTPIADGDLEDVTAVLSPVIPANARGWKISLNAASGEKVLAEARTFQNKVFFTTFTPNQAAANSCVPRPGDNRLYIVSVADGSPVNNLDGEGSDEELTLEDRVQELNQGGIAPEVVFLFPAQEPDACDDSQPCLPPEPVCLVGVERCEPPFTNPAVRTFWRQDGAE